MPALRLQPKQAQTLETIEGTEASWIGIGGGRGGAKSGGMQRIMLARRTGLPGTVAAILMRNYDQVKKYHIDPMLRAYPELEQYFKISDKRMVLPCEGGKKSEIHFMYAESLADVIRVFRSANYYDVFIDQAEQFTEAELREIKQAVRWPGTGMGACKLLLAFNMGGVGIEFLRRVFHLKEYRDGERKEDFAFVHVYPWDNVEWVRVALEQDGLTEHDYYQVFTEAQRIEYCATRGDYGRNLVSQDEPLRKRDWLGSWESLEGAYFARVFDRDSTVVTPDQVTQLIKPWWKHWLSQDWGRSHYCTTHWHTRGDVSPEEAKRILGWDVDKPVSVTLTYREYVAGGSGGSDEGAQREIAEQDIARGIVERSPKNDRDMLRRFFLSPDAFAKRSSANTIDSEIGDILVANDLPRPEKADDDRIGGWGLMYNMLLETKRHGATGGESWLISANCTEAIRTIPLLMRDPKNLDDVLKTDKGAAKLEQDVADDLRYGLKSMLSPGTKPKHVELQEVLQAIPDNTQKHMAYLKFTHDKKQHSKGFTLKRR